MSAKGEAKYFPLKKAEIESFLLIANEYIYKTSGILGDHYRGNLILGEFSLMKVGMIQYYSQSLKVFIEKNFDPQFLKEDEAYQAYPQEIQSMAKIIVTIGTAKKDLSVQNIFLENQ